MSSFPSFVCSTLMEWLDLQIVIESSGCLGTWYPRGEQGGYQGKPNAGGLGMWFLGLFCIDPPSWVGGAFAKVSVSELSLESTLSLQEESWAASLSCEIGPFHLSEPLLSHLWNRKRDASHSSVLLEGPHSHIYDFSPSVHITWTTALSLAVSWVFLRKTAVKIAKILALRELTICK